MLAAPGCETLAGYIPAKYLLRSWAPAVQVSADWSRQPRSVNHVNTLMCSSSCYSAKPYRCHWPRCPWIGIIRNTLIRHAGRPPPADQVVGSCAAIMQKMPTRQMVMLLRGLMMPMLLISTDARSPAGLIAPPLLIALPCPGCDHDYSSMCPKARPP